MSEFDDIRPYNDSEVDAVLARVARSDELASAIAKLRFPRWNPRFGWLLRPLVKWFLSRRARNIHTVDELQQMVGELMERMLEDSVTEFTVSGLENLDVGQSYLFISNHRDIAMDPALVNWALRQHGLQTVRIAIGDNLLSKPFVSDLMRLNKSFIVRRSLKTRKEKFQASRLLSQYIYHSLIDDGCNVWIAQREGRAKDGRDITNAALISMLSLSKSKETSFTQHIGSMNMVPVAISYEWDPCDRDKAKELQMLRDQGRYLKAEHEDIGSIAKGITGMKGHVHLSFGKVLSSSYETAEDVAAEVDQQIWQTYLLQPSNLRAYEILSGGKVDSSVLDCECYGEQERAEADRELQLRLASTPEEQRDLLLLMYANPVLSRLSLVEQKRLAS